MLLASSVNTPIDNNRSHLLALQVRVLCEKGLKPRTPAGPPSKLRWNKIQCVLPKQGDIQICFAFGVHRENSWADVATCRQLAASRFPWSSPPGRCKCTAHRILKQRGCVGWTVLGTSTTQVLRVAVFFTLQEEWSRKLNACPQVCVCLLDRVPSSVGYLRGQSRAIATHLPARHRCSMRKGNGRNSGCAIENMIILSIKMPSKMVRSHFIFNIYPLLRETLFITQLSINRCGPLCIAFAGWFPRMWGSLLQSLQCGQ